MAPLDRLGDIHHAVEWLAGLSRDIGAGAELGRHRASQVDFGY